MNFQPALAPGRLKISNFRASTLRQGREDPAIGEKEKEGLIYVIKYYKMTYMKAMVKTQVYLRKSDLDALRAAARRTGRSMAALIRDAIHLVCPPPASSGPVALWKDRPRKTSMEHDSIYDEVR